MLFNCGIMENIFIRGSNKLISNLIDFLSTNEEDFNLLLLQNCSVIKQDSINDFIDYAQIKEDYSIILDRYAKIADDFSVYLSPGIMLEAELGNLYWSSVLYNPKGELILKQRQIYIEQEKRFLKKIVKKDLTNLDDFDKENELAIKAGKSINYANTELGKIGIMLNQDCWHPQIGRIMALDGVDIVLAVNKMKDLHCNKGVYNPWQQLAGVWSQVQQNQFIAVEASIGGQNLIHAPCEITPYRTGIIAPKAIDKKPAENNIIDYFDTLSRNYKQINGFKIISSEVNMDRLKKIRSSYPLMKYLNKPLYCKEMGGGK